MQHHHHDHAGHDHAVHRHDGDGHDGHDRGGPGLRIIHATVEPEFGQCADQRVEQVH